MNTLVATALRDILKALAAFGIVHGTYTNSQVSFVAGIIVAVISVVWSWAQKFYAARLEHQGNLKSAETQEAVRASRRGFHFSGKKPLPAA